MIEETKKKLYMDLKLKLVNKEVFILRSFFGMKYFIR